MVVQASAGLQMADQAVHHHLLSPYGYRLVGGRRHGVGVAYAAQGGAQSAG